MSKEIIEKKGVFYVDVTAISASALTKKQLKLLVDAGMESAVEELAKRGREADGSRKGAPEERPLIGAGTAELVKLAAGKGKDKKAAVQELATRGRNPDGTKVGKGKPSQVPAEA